MNKWQSIENLRKIDKGISGKSYMCKDNFIPEGAHATRCKLVGDKFVDLAYSKDEPIYVKNNNGVIEYSLESDNLNDTFLERKTYPVDDSIFKSSAGEIDLYDEGEFGGKLEIGGKFVERGNFNHIFMFKGRKYVIDSLHHMCCKNFRIIEIMDNGKINILYNSDKLFDIHKEFYEKYSLIDEKQAKKIFIEENKEKYLIDKSYEIGFELMKLTDNKIYFFCEGAIFKYNDDKNNSHDNVKYILEYDGDTFKETLLEINDWMSDINSIEIINDIIYFGMDKQIIKYNLNNKNYDILTFINEDKIKNMED